MMTIEEFCDEHCACCEGRMWALANCRDMQEAWDTARGEWVVWIASRCGVLSYHDLLKFAVRNARAVASLIREDKRSMRPVELAERILRGERIGALTIVRAKKAASTACNAAWKAVDNRYSHVALAKSVAYDCLAMGDENAWTPSVAMEIAETTASALVKHARACGTRSSYIAHFAHMADYLRKNTKPCFD